SCASPWRSAPAPDPTSWPCSPTSLASLPKTAGPALQETELPGEGPHGGAHLFLADQAGDVGMGVDRMVDPHPCLGQGPGDAGPHPGEAVHAGPHAGALGQPAGHLEPGPPAGEALPHLVAQLLVDDEAQPVGSNVDHIHAHPRLGHTLEELVDLLAVELAPGRDGPDPAPGPH